MSRRFVAGETLDDAVGAARKCNDLGMMASLDYLGENVATTPRYRCGAGVIPLSYGFDSDVANTHLAGAESVYESGFFHQDNTFI